MGKSLLKVFQVIIFVYLVLIASLPINDADFWFHLKTGQYFFATGGVPRSELYSFTYHGIPWVAHGWLSGVLFYAIWSVVGPKLLIFLFALLTAVAFWIACKRADSHPFFAGLAVLIGIWTSLPNIGVRPRIFTILFTSIYLALLGRLARGIEERWIWLLVPLMVLWANLHGAFLIGLALIVLTTAGIIVDRCAGVLDEPASFSARLRTLALLFVGCGLAALLNPYGLRLYIWPIAVLRSPIFQDLVNDWLSPNFHLVGTRPLMVLILITTAVLALSPKRPKPSEVLMVLATLYATLKTQRNAILFALVTVPLVATYFQIWFETTRFGKSFGRFSSDLNPRLAVLLVLAFLLPLALFAGKLKTRVYATPTQEVLGVPVRAVEYLKQNGVAGNTITVPNVWGAYLLWAAPNNPVYIDGRDVYPDTFVKEYVDIYKGRLDWRRAFDEKRVQIVLIEPDTLLARELGDSPGWEKIYQDDMSVVFRRF